MNRSRLISSHAIFGLLITFCAIGAFLLWERL